MGASTAAATSVPGRKLHPLVRLVDVMASVAAHAVADDEYDEDDRFNLVDPDEHLFRASTEVENSKNPKGYIDRYRPQERSRLLIHQIKQILAANEEYLPLTIRQVFYRMVARHGCPRSSMTRSWPGSTRRRTRRFCGKRRPSGTGSPGRSCRDISTVTSAAVTVLRAAPR
jgi:hypothetical protein